MFNKDSSEVISFRISLPFIVLIMAKTLPSVVQAVRTFSWEDVFDKRVAFFFVKSSATTTLDPLSFRRFLMSASFDL